LVSKTTYTPPSLVAEIGCNHMGDFSIALDLINQAKTCGAIVAKFQKRNIRTFLTQEQYDAEHPVPSNSFGKTYGQHREFLEFSIEQHKELQKHCQSIGIDYACSVWDVVSAADIIALNPSYIKVPSACNTNIDLLNYLRDHFNGFVHISVGMTTQQEKKQLVEVFNQKNQQNRLIIYSCTSGYPVSSKDVCLLEIQTIYQEFGNKIHDIGFSGHHLGTAIDIAAYTLGANWIERHFTLNKTWKGTDHSASLEPNDFFKLSSDLKKTYKALNYKNAEILEVEYEQRNKLKHKG
jgi:sialic acid synthase